MVSGVPANMNPDAQALSIMRGQVGGIALGSIFLFIGVAAMATAALRRRYQVGLVLWFGIFSSLYGARMLAQSPAMFAALPQSWWPARPYVIAIITYAIFVPALLFWLELSIGRFRYLLRVALVFAALFAIAATAAALAIQKPFAYTNPNSVFAIGMMLLLGIVNAVPALARRCLSEPSRVLATGSLVLAAVALLNNLGNFFSLPNFQRLEPLAFAVFVFSLGYVAAQGVFSNERHLLAIQNELEIAREIQQSILPVSVPQLKKVRVAASYRPVASVAGDFYEFLPVDEDHIGFLVADVSGHGVPAALIASMIKVAMHSVSQYAASPARLIRGLNEILSHQLRGQFVTAAYLFLDLQSQQARYSAAGHPPLLCWDKASAELRRIESNGLLFGVLENTDYPEREIPLRGGDRFLLYTDGLVEAENEGGEAFGDRQLPSVLASNAALPAAELSARILEDLSHWQGRTSNRQDDVTTVMIDLL